MYNNLSTFKKDLSPIPVGLSFLNLSMTSFLTFPRKVDQVVGHGGGSIETDVTVRQRVLGNSPDTLVPEDFITVERTRIKIKRPFRLMDTLCLRLLRSDNMKLMDTF